MGEIEEGEIVEDAPAVAVTKEEVKTSTGKRTRERSPTHRRGESKRRRIKERDEERKRSPQRDRERERVRDGHRDNGREREREREGGSGRDRRSHERDRVSSGREMRSHERDRHERDRRHNHERERHHNYERDWRERDGSRRSAERVGLRDRSSVSYDSRSSSRRVRGRDAYEGRGDGRDDRSDYRRNEEERERRREEEEAKRRKQEREEEEYRELVRKQLEDQEAKREAERLLEERREQRRLELLVLAQTPSKRASPSSSSSPSSLLGDTTGDCDDSDKKERSEMEERQQGSGTEERSQTESDDASGASEEKAEHSVDKRASNAPSQRGYGVPRVEETPLDKDDDDLNLFSDSPIRTNITVSSQAVGLGVAEDWDDPEGYLKLRIGEVVDGRFRVLGSHGKGVFSTVLRAADIENDDREVAIKVSRNNETMKTAGAAERDYLVELAQHKNNRFCIRLLSWFEYKSHLCLVLETMENNLRDVIKQYGTGVGISIRAVQVYSFQLLHALKVLKECHILHADIKPDNIVVSKDKKLVKICDFGTGLRTTDENAKTPLLVSRFYRPPEVILGMEYDEQVDIWSVGCCMAEMYTGKILFPGRDNNQMLRLHMGIKGKFPKKMIRHGIFAAEHFDLEDSLFPFTAHVADVVDATKIVLRKEHIQGPDKDLLHVLAPDLSQVPAAEMVHVRQLRDLLDKIFVLDPKKRVTVEIALQHPFITSAGLGSR